MNSSKKELLAAAAVLTLLALFAAQLRSHADPPAATQTPVTTANLGTGVAPALAASVNSGGGLVTGSGLATGSTAYSGTAGTLTGFSMATGQSIPFNFAGSWFNLVLGTGVPAGLTYPANSTNGFVTGAGLASGTAAVLAASPNQLPTGGTNGSTYLNSVGIYPETYGAKGDDIPGTNGNATASGTTFNCATAAWHSADAGKWIGIVSGTAPIFSGTISYVAASGTSIGLSGTAMLSSTTCSFEYATNDSVALQSAWNVMQGTGLPLILSKTYAISTTLSGTGLTNIIGTGCVSLHGSITAGLQPGTDGPAVAPYLKGAVLLETASNTDAVDLTGSGQNAALKSFGIRYADPIKFRATGNGIFAQASALPSTTGTGSDHGVIDSTWQDLFVYGHDVNHYAYWLTNTLNVTGINLHSFGGGGFTGYQSSSADNYGNLQLVGGYFCTCLGGGTGSGNAVQFIYVTQGGGNYPNLFSMYGTQATVASEAGITPIPTTAQHTYYSNFNSFQCSFFGIDWETNISGLVSSGIASATIITQGVVNNAVGYCQIGAKISNQGAFDFNNFTGYDRISDNAGNIYYDINAGAFDYWRINNDTALGMSLNGSTGVLTLYAGLASSGPINAGTNTVTGGTFNGNVISGNTASFGVPNLVLSGTVTPAVFTGTYALSGTTSGGYYWTMVKSGTTYYIARDSGGTSTTTWKISNALGANGSGGDLYDNNSEGAAAIPVNFTHWASENGSSGAPSVVAGTAAVSMDNAGDIAAAASISGRTLQTSGLTGPTWTSGTSAPAYSAGQSNGSLYSYLVTSGSAQLFELSGTTWVGY